jgi:hypothetical protein
VVQWLDPVMVCRIPFLPWWMDSSQPIYLLVSSLYLRMLSHILGMETMVQVLDL